MSYTQKELKSIAENACNKLLEAKEGINLFNEPFKHIYIDNFFPEDFVQESLKAFPDTNDYDWEVSNDRDIEVKYRTKWDSEFDIPDGIINTVRVLNSSVFLRAMSKILGIEKLVADPYFSGGGLNVTKRGGLLDVHVDGNYHDATGLNRRVNAILYLNPGWEEPWGGEFGIYDNMGNRCVKKIAPLFNRLVIFDTHDKSFHGLPDPINFPQETPRKSIILYYYTKETRPLEHTLTEEPHSALWKKRNFNDKLGNKTRNHN